MNEIQRMFVERVSNEMADELLVTQCALSMEHKLTKKRGEGRGGWHGPNCSEDELMGMLKAHVDKGDMVDVMNLAGMIHIRRKIYGADNCN